MRSWFGGSPTDWTMQIDSVTRAVLANGGVPLTFWSSATGGFQYTVLYGGNEVTTIYTGDGSSMPLGAVPEFQGPDTDPPIRRMYVQAGTSPYRFMMTTTDPGSYSDAQIAAQKSRIDSLDDTVVRKSIVQDTAPGATMYELRRNYPISTNDADADVIYGPANEKLSWRNETGHYRAKTYSGNPSDPQYRAIAEDYQVGHAFQLQDNKTIRNTIWGVTPDGGTEVNGIRMSYVLFLGKSDNIPTGTPPNTLIVRF